MAEKPIVMNEFSVNAILAGRKTMTRRLIKLQPEQPIYANGDWYADIYNGKNDWYLWGKRGTDVFNKLGHGLGKSKYEKGDRLWVKEAYRVDEKYDHVV